MRTRCLAAAALAAACGAALCPAPGAARAGDPVKDREAMLRAFDLMLAKNKGEPVPRLQVKIPGDAGGDAKAMVKVWARLYDRKEKRRTDEVVCLTARKWEPEEYFVLCFQAAAPVQFFMYNVVPQPDGNTKIEQLLPSAKRKSSFQPIPAGQVYEMPFPLAMENHRKPEVVQFGFFTTDHPNLPEPPKPDAGEGEYNIQAGKITGLVTEARNQGLKVAGLEVGPPPRESTRIVTNPDGVITNQDEVALILAIKETGGIAQLTLQKKP